MVIILFPFHSIKTIGAIQAKLQFSSTQTPLSTASKYNSNKTTKLGNQEQVAAVAI